uniref:Uncharacterized protein n=1 Tax=Oryza brachyantha TaxID=4533 RepID=J3MJ31_ORYBR
MTETKLPTPTAEEAVGTSPRWHGRRGRRSLDGGRPTEPSAASIGTKLAAAGPSPAGDGLTKIYSRDSS